MKINIAVPRAIASSSEPAKRPLPNASESAPNDGCTRCMSARVRFCSTSRHDRSPGAYVLQSNGEGNEHVRELGGDVDRGKGNGAPPAEPERNPAGRGQSQSPEDRVVGYEFEGRNDRVAQHAVDDDREIGFGFRSQHDVHRRQSETCGADRSPREPPRRTRGPRFRRTKNA